MSAIAFLVVTLSVSIDRSFCRQDSGILRRGRVQVAWRVSLRFIRIARIPLADHESDRRHSCLFLVEQDISLGAEPSADRGP